MKQVSLIGIKDEAARMKVTPPLAVAPHVHGDDMRWKLNDDGINFNPYKGAARPSTTTSAAPQHPSRSNNPRLNTKH